MTIKYEVPCPFLPPGHYVAKGTNVTTVANDLAWHCYQNHRNEPEDVVRSALTETTEAQQPTA